MSLEETDAQTPGVLFVSFSNSILHDNWKKPKIRKHDLLLRCLYLLNQNQVPVFL